ncbi:MAG: MBL fold metallo-hydrolase [Clostridia bacterium]|nr:MBL fold metallo-hydrolase [Clostridia bacterium]
MRITVLTENTTEYEGIIPEHGLSLYIETDNHKILFDFGQTDTMFKNAVKLGVDLSDVDTAVLSHGHYDHGGGLAEFFKVNDKALVYVNENAFGDYRHGDKYIGLNQEIKNNSRIVFVSSDYSIDESISVCMLQRLIQPIDASGLTYVENNSEEAEIFSHEQYLLINEDGKRYLFSGCSHKGIMNIADFFKPDIFIGGFHLMNMDMSSKNDICMLEKYADDLLSYNCHYYTCHCTGNEQYVFLKNKMQDKLFYLSCGSTIEL